MGPITATQWLNAGSQVLGAALSPKSAGPSRADSGSGAYTYSPFDSSGWTVATGASQAKGQQDLPWAWLILGGIAVLILWKRL